MPSSRPGSGQARIGALDALKAQLPSCSHMANKQFSAIETQNIIKYLNEQFYQFG